MKKTYEHTLKKQGSFGLASIFSPCGDQPRAISKIIRGYNAGMRHQTLLGVTGSGKTYTMANVIAQLNQPTLIISHNKTLAAQLFSEMKIFFPENSVQYFVSYYDYYQPEAYVPAHDLYIEKDASVNEQIERMRLAATSALMERNDVVVVSSVSCIYGIGSPDEYRRRIFRLKVGEKWERKDFARRLVDLLYERNEIDPMSGSFRMKGDTIDIFPPYQERGIRVEFWGDEIESLKIFEPVSGKTTGSFQEGFIFPAKHYLVDPVRFEKAIRDIEKELTERVQELLSDGRLAEAERLERRTRYDLELLRETGYCTGIENYSRHLDGRKPGEPPYTLLDYFPEGSLVIIDESHVTIPQLRGMLHGDRSRKRSLVDFGFRLASSFDNRPLCFEEFEERIGKVMYVSATPASYEISKSEQVVEQLIRPTGLVDPLVEIRPAKGQVEDLVFQIRKTTEKGFRTLVTTLTKRSAEDLCEYLRDLGIRVKYLHSEIDTLERARIIRELRAGEFDVLVGINLLREGLDLPEVAQVAILDADKEGFLRSEVSLVQTIGRAARNVEGRAILYADHITGSLERAVEETNRRRTVQLRHNEDHGIIPQTVLKEVRDIFPDIVGLSPEAEKTLSFLDSSEQQKIDVEELVEKLTHEMHEASKHLEFERAALMRDEIFKLKRRMENKTRSRK